MQPWKVTVALTATVAGVAATLLTGRLVSAISARRSTSSSDPCAGAKATES